MSLSASPRAAPQHDTTPQRQRLRNTMRAFPTLQRLTLCSGQLYDHSSTSYTHLVVSFTTGSVSCQQQAHSSHSANLPLAGYHTFTHKPRFPNTTNPENSTAPNKETTLRPPQPQQATTPSAYPTTTPSRYQPTHKKHQQQHTKQTPTPNTKYTTTKPTNFQDRTLGALAVYEDTAGASRGMGCSATAELLGMPASRRRRIGLGAGGGSVGQGAECEEWCY